MHKDIFHVIGVTVITGLAVIGLLVIWTGLDINGDEDDTVIIEYTCSEVLPNQGEYPAQVVKECKIKRNIPVYEGKV